MLYRYLQIGIIAVAVVLLATVLITAKTDSRGTQREAASAEAAAADRTTALPAPGSEPNANRIIAPAANQSKAVLDVQGMSCSGCISNIKSSLAGIEGIRDVLVDISSGRVEVYYDDSKLKAVDQIASAITAAGYPASLKRTLNANEVENENNILASRSKLFIAAVGDWEIARSDYEIELRHARARYEEVYGKNIFMGAQGEVLLQRLKSQVASRLITEGIQMQEIRKSGFKLPTPSVQSEFNSFLSQKGMTLDSFKRTIEDSGYDFAYFLKKFENQMTINLYVEEKVLNGILNDVEKRQQYSDWFNNARLLAKVVYYDRELETIAKNSSSASGCGSSCTRQ
jgi:copper chaperone